MITTSHNDRKYSVISYDPTWKKGFERESVTLQKIFGSLALAIEHVGSTAVPGLAGKPTLDLLILVDNIAPIDSFNDVLQTAGYDALGAFVSPGTRLFIREVEGERLCNVHVFPKDHPHAQEMLDLRNYLRRHPNLVREYSQLKFDLFKKYPQDYASYRRHKDAWMERLKVILRKKGR